MSQTLQSEPASDGGMTEAFTSETIKEKGAARGATGVTGEIATEDSTAKPVRYSKLFMSCSNSYAPSGS